MGDELLQKRARNSLELALVVATMMLEKKFATAADALTFIHERTESEAQAWAVSMMVKNIMTTKAGV